MAETPSTSHLEEAMASPKKVEVDDRTVESHSLSDMIAMDRYIESKKASRKGTGIRFMRMSAGGAVR